MSIKPQTPGETEQNDEKPSFGMAHPTVKPGWNTPSERQVAERVGKSYMKTPTPTKVTDEVQKLANKLIQINATLFETVTDDIDIIPTEDDPYSSYEEMCEDIQKNKRMYVFSGGTHPAYFGDTEDERRENNVIARAVHDYLGHYANSVGFNFWGEFQKFHAMKSCYPDELEPLLFTEVVCQTGAAYYLEGGFSNPLFEQKPILAHEGWIRTCYFHFPGDLER